MKRCRGCGIDLHVRKLKCPCGYAFSSKPRLTSIKNVEASRRESNASRQACKRALESEHELQQRRQANAVCLARRRSQESEQESEHRRQINTASWLLLTSPRS